MTDINLPVEKECELSPVVEVTGIAVEWEDGIVDVKVVVPREGEVLVLEKKDGRAIAVEDGVVVVDNGVSGILVVEDGDSGVMVVEDAVDEVVLIGVAVYIAVEVKVIGYGSVNILVFEDVEKIVGVAVEAKSEKEEGGLDTVVDTVGPEVERVNIAVEVTVLEVEMDEEMMVKDEDDRAVVAEEYHGGVILVEDAVTGISVVEDGSSGVMVLEGGVVFIKNAVDVSVTVEVIGYVSLNVLVLEKVVEKVVRAAVEIKSVIIGTMAVVVVVIRQVVFSLQSPTLTPVYSQAAA